MSVVLRDYQVKVIDAARRSVMAGRRRPLIVSPTGSGKTVTAASIVQGAVARGGKVAWFAHRKELREQAIGALAQFGIQSGYGRIGTDRAVQVVSVQGASRRQTVPEADLVVFDEAHHFAADDWARLPAAYGDKTVFVGLTATPERGDGRGLGHIFNDLHVAAQPEDLVNLWRNDQTQGLVPCEVIRPSRIQPAGKISMTPAEAYKQYARGRRNVVFAPNLEEAQRFEEQFLAEGEHATIVHGALDRQARQTRLSRFENGYSRILINVYVLTEGWDCPAADVCTIARKMGTAGMYIQAVGRVLRPSPGKTSAMVLDLAGVSHVHGSPLDEREYSLDGVGITTKQAAMCSFCRLCGNELQPGEPCSVCGSQRMTEAFGYTGDPMEKYAKIRTDSESERAERLYRFLKQAADKGYKPGWAIHKYKAVYGCDAPGHILALAKRMNG